MNKYDRRKAVQIAGAAFLCAVSVNRTSASFTYDLRFAPNGNPPGIISPDLHRIDILLPDGPPPPPENIYKLELWGRITGDTNFANDVWTTGFVSVQSTITGVQTAIYGLGLVNGQVNATNFPYSPNNGVSNNITNDGLGDWGSNVTDNSTQGNKWMRWTNFTSNNSPPFPGFIPNAVVPGLSQPYAGDPTHSWEVLIATFDLHVVSWNIQFYDHYQTTFNLVAIPDTIRANGGVLPQHGLIYYQDGSTTPSFDGQIGSGVTFSVAAFDPPEPHSLGILSVGGMALLARRRKLIP